MLMIRETREAWKENHRYCSGGVEYQQKMRYIISILTGCGIVLFFFGAVMRLMGTACFLNAELVAWWRASNSLCAHPNSRCSEGT
jgi:hypothetical protein